MITRIIDNEKEYLDFIADIIECGIHHANPYVRDRDEDGLHIADSFDCFCADELFEQLGVYLEDEPLPDTLINTVAEDGQEWEEYSNHFHKWKSEYRTKLKVIYDNPHVITPKPEDYPIIINFHWYNDFDRMGNIKERLFNWWGLKELRDIPKDSIRKTRETWEAKFRDLLDKNK